MNNLITGVWKYCLTARTSELRDNNDIKSSYKKQNNNFLDKVRNPLPLWCKEFSKRK